MPQSIDATVKPATETMKTSLAAEAVGEPAGHRRHDRGGDDVGGRAPR